MNGKVENEMVKKNRDKMLQKGEIDYQMTMQTGKKWKQCSSDFEIKFSKVEETSRDQSQFYK